MSDKPEGPIAIASIPTEVWSEGVRYGGSTQVLSNTRTGGRKIGIAIEVLNPGKQSCPHHYHMVEEEHIIGLEGEATLRLGDQRFPIKAGDYVAFPAGARVGHCLLNEGEKPFKFLIVGDRAPNEVCVYPDSGKIMIYNLERKILRDAESIEYWADEKANEPLP
ncbi:MAG: cupin domain-containing protein [Hyphomonadaceae bacterium]